jgi:hypothetical protein
MSKTSLHAVLLERNRMVGRRLARLLACAGIETIAVEDPRELGGALKPLTALFGCDAQDIELARTLLGERRELQVWLWTSDPLDRLLPHAVEEPRLSNLFGRAGAEATPRDREVLLAARRLGGEQPPFSGHLGWGASGFQEQPRNVAGRDRAVAAVQTFADRIGCPRRVGEMMAEVAHELLMNAMYDAPVGADGQPRFAHDRKAAVALGPGEEPTLRVGCDGATVALQVTDPFGRLLRGQVFAGLLRGLNGGEMSRAGGGAGLGMAKMHQATVAMFFDVTAGQRTEVTGLYDLDLNQREFRTLPKSVHFFSRAGA